MHAALAASLVLSGLLCAPALGASGYALTQGQGAERLLISISPAGVSFTERARECSKCRVRPIMAFTAIFGSGRALLVDPAHRTYATVTLSQLADVSDVLATAQRVPDLGIVFAPPPDTVTPAGTQKIAGELATGFLVRDGRVLRRVWYANSLPAVPGRYASLLNVFGGRMTGSLGALLKGERGRLPLRIEVWATDHWERLLDTNRVSFRRAVAFSLRPPRHYRPTRLIPKSRAAVDVTARPANVPASLFYFGAGPISPFPQISAIYWGQFFHDSPGVVATLNRDLAQMASGSDGYIGPLRQYGVMTGSFNSSITLNSDPPRHVGSVDVYSIENMLFTHLHGNMPRSWGIFSSTSPIVMIFVPASVVDSGNWDGYHFYVPTEQGLLPWNFPAVPWTIAKVPDTADPAGFNGMIDTAMVNASHEFVEAATDPYPFTAWSDPEKHPVFALGEAADICSTGNTQPWGAKTRLSGVAYSTYWSNNDSGCVPESRPTVTITSPAAGSTLGCPSAPVAATALDPFDGRLFGSSFTWFVDGTSVSPLAGRIRLSPGPHIISVTAADSQRLVGRASENITVAPPPAPTASIAAPPPGSRWGSDQNIAFSGSATDTCDGTLSGSALAWTENGATFGNGNATSHTFAQGTHTVTLTATNSSGRTGSATVTFTVGPPSGNPSPAIQQPVNGQNVDINQPVSFQGSATDPTDGTLSGGSLQWYDSYSDATGGCGCSVNLGSGASFSAKLPVDPLPATHVITLVATDSLGHSARTSVTITSTNFQ